MTKDSYYGAVNEKKKNRFGSEANGRKPNKPAHNWFERCKNVSQRSAYVPTYILYASESHDRTVHKVNRCSTWIRRESCARGSPFADSRTDYTLNERRKKTKMKREKHHNIPITYLLLCARIDHAGVQHTITDQRSWNKKTYLFFFAL